MLIFLHFYTCNPKRAFQLNASSTLTCLSQKNNKIGFKLINGLSKNILCFVYLKYIDNQVLETINLLQLRLLKYNNDENKNLKN